MAADFLSDSIHMSLRARASEYERAVNAVVAAGVESLPQDEKAITDCGRQLCVPSLLRRWLSLEAAGRAHVHKRLNEWGDMLEKGDVWLVRLSSIHRRSPQPADWGPSTTADLQGIVSSHPSRSIGERVRPARLEGGPAGSAPRVAESLGQRVCSTPRPLFVVLTPRS